MGNYPRIGYVRDVKPVIHYGTLTEVFLIMSHVPLGWLAHYIITLNIIIIIVQIITMKYYFSTDLT